MKKAIFYFVPIAIVITGFCLLVYVAVQQSYRTSLNDPQIQLAEDGAAMLKNGLNPVDVVGRQPLFDAGLSLAPFVAVYDESGLPLEASAFINNAPPKPPIGVFDYTRMHGEDRITWQPDSNTRVAIVLVHIDRDGGGFVMAGRNMREVEKREQSLLYIVATFWIVLLIFTLLFVLVFAAKS